MRPLKHRTGWLVAAALAAAPHGAGAYCLRSACGGAAATRCTPARADDCGAPVHWPAGAVRYRIAATDEPLRPAVDAALARAFALWRAVDCGGGHPDLAIAALPADPASGLAGVVELEDHPAAAQAGRLAVTRLQFTPDAGRVIAAHIAFDRGALHAHGPGAFLDAIALHEAGHFLGLAHSHDPAAVMSEEVGEIPRTELARDDAAAICASYPPQRSARAPGAVEAASPALLVALVVAGWLVRRPRR